MKLLKRGFSLHVCQDFFMWIPFDFDLWKVHIFMPV
jgi:hypothetical protein